MSDSYFRHDTTKLNTFNHFLDSEHKTLIDDDLYRLGIGGYHPQVAIGILDASSILRFNIRNAWLPLNKQFFD